MRHSIPPGFKEHASGLLVPDPIAEASIGVPRPAPSECPQTSMPRATPKRRHKKGKETETERLYRFRNKRLQDTRLRPARREDVVGQDDALALVELLLSANPPTHILLLGPSGCGKTTIARLALDLAKKSRRSVFKRDAPFVAVDGASIQHDRYNNIGAFATVVVEGFYGGSQDANARLNLHPDTPRLYLGTMARAHLGVLFIDEIGELRHESQTSLLTVLEEGMERIQLRAHGEWMKDRRTPLWLREFVENGVPASFVLMGATTRHPKDLDAALRSRCEIVPIRALNVVERSEVARRTSVRLGIAISEEAAMQIARNTASPRATARGVVLAAAAATRRLASQIDVKDVRASACGDRVGFRH